jgi:hypothetical protein
MESLKDNPNVHITSKCSEKGRIIHEYTCLACNQSFPRKSRIERHLPVHTNERPFACGFRDCDRVFSRKDNRDKHHENHLNKRPRKTYSWKRQQPLLQFMLPDGTRTNINVQYQRGYIPVVDKHYIMIHNRFITDEYYLQKFVV